MWLGYEDSNLGMPESESGALPLGDTPRKAKSSPKRAFLMWLGYEDSNLGMPESESGALPLGDTPTNWFLNLPNIFDTFRIWWLRRDSNL